MTGGGGTLRGLLVIGEVATAVLLLFGAGLLLRTLMAVEGFDRGYRAESVLSMLVDPLGSKYPTPESLQQFYDQVEAEVAARSGRGGRRVGRLSAARLLRFRRTLVRDRRRSSRRRQPAADDRVSGGQPGVLLDARSAHPRRARVRSARYGGTAFPSASSTRRFARSFHGRSPIGQHVALRPTVGRRRRNPSIREIVGVARQVKGRPDEAKDFVQLYVPMAQDLSDDMFLVVRPKSGRAEALAPVSPRRHFPRRHRAARQCQETS